MSKELTCLSKRRRYGNAEFRKLKDQFPVDNSRLCAYNIEV